MQRKKPGKSVKPITLYHKEAIHKFTKQSIEETAYKRFTGNKCKIILVSSTASTNNKCELGSFSEYVISYDGSFNKPLGC